MKGERKREFRFLKELGMSPPLNVVRCLGPPLPFHGSLIHGCGCYHIKYLIEFPAATIPPPSSSSLLSGVGRVALRCLSFFLSSREGNFTRASLSIRLATFN